MSRLIFIFAILGCTSEKTFTPVVCDNLVCFPDYTSKVGPSYATKQECRQYLNDMKRDEDRYYYCRESR